MLPHAPGVQMADIPEDGVSLEKEDEEVDAADPDQRGNPKLLDQAREADNEFEEGKSVGLPSLLSSPLSSPLSIPRFLLTSPPPHLSLSSPLPLLTTNPG